MFYQDIAAHHKFHIKDSLKRSVEGGLFGICSVFSHYCWHKTIPIEIGSTIPITTTTDSELKAFAAFATPKNTPSHINIDINSNQNGIYIHSSKFENWKNISSGELSVAVYHYKTTSDVGWITLFYDSISDFTKAHHSLSIFKLATSIEIYTDHLYETYVKNHSSMSSDIIDEMVSSARTWRAKSERITYVIKEMLGKQAALSFKTFLKCFERDVRVPRNAFAHGLPKGWDYDSAAAAFVSAFDILWLLIKLEQRLSTVHP